jgi:carbamoyl-phosphate synthase large subunit
MGVGANFGEAFAKAQLSAGMPLPDKGCVFISVNKHDKPAAVDVARRLVEFGFCLVATRGTAAVLQAAGLKARTVFKVNEGRPNAVDFMSGFDPLVIYTPGERHSFSDERAIRPAPRSHLRSRASRR